MMVQQAEQLLLLRADLGFIPDTTYDPEMITGRCGPKINEIRQNKKSFNEAYSIFQKSLCQHFKTNVESNFVKNIMLIFLHN